MAEYLDITGRIRTTASDNNVVETQEVFDNTKQQKQSTINSDFESRIAALHAQDYLYYDATSDDTSIATILPSTGTTGKIYRIANWNANTTGVDPDTYYNTAYYSEYAWDANASTPAYTLLSVSASGITDTPAYNDPKLITSKGIYNKLAERGVYDISIEHPTSGYNSGNTYAGLAAALAVVPATIKKAGMSIRFIDKDSNKYEQYHFLDSDTTNFTDISHWSFYNDDALVDNPEWLRVIIDSQDRILAGIKSDGTVEWLLGVPTPVKEYIGTNIAAIWDGNSGTALDGLTKIIAFLDDLTTANTLKSMLDLKVSQTSQGDATIGRNLTVTGTSTLNSNTTIGGTLEVTGNVDLNAKLTVDGDIETPSVTQQSIENPEYLTVITDGSGRILGGRKTNGTMVENVGIEAKSLKLSDEGLQTLKEDLDVQIPTLEELGGVAKDQGAINQGKILVVGSDGNVTVGENTPSGVLIGYGKIENTLTLNVKADSASEVSVGTGWSGSLVNGYTHTSGNTAPLVLGHTTAGKSYIVTLGFSDLSEASVEVKIGNGYPVDPYNGTLQARIGFVSDGGDLTIIPTSSYTGTITAKLQEVTDSEHSEEEIVIPINNFDAGLMVNDLTGFWNIAIGPNTQTLGANINASRNIGIGYSSLGSLQSGSRNIGLGTFALAQLKNGKGNIGIGADTYYRSQGGNDNIAIGRASMGGTTSQINGNVCVGQSAGEQATGDDNVCVGRNAGYYANSGNVFIGLNTGYSHQSGVNNTFIGRNAGYSGAQRSGNWNICIGPSASISNNVSKSTAIGFQASASKNNQIVLGNYSDTAGNGTVETLIHGDFVVRGTDGIMRKIIFNNDNSVSWETLS